MQSNFVTEIILFLLSAQANRIFDFQTMLNEKNHRNSVTHAHQIIECKIFLEVGRIRQVHDAHRIKTKKKKIKVDKFNGFFSRLMFQLAFVLIKKKIHTSGIVHRPYKKCNLKYVFSSFSCSSFTCSNRFRFS